MEEGKFTRGQWIIWGGILILLVLLTASPLFFPQFHGEVYDEPRPIDFTLTRADGGEFHLSDYQGRVVVLYFGYTSCPDICPTTLFDLNRTMDELGEKSEDITIAFITVDPETDTPAKMDEYVGYFNPEFIGLVGSNDALISVYSEFGVSPPTPDEIASGRNISHNSSVFVIDKSGRLRMRMHYGSRPQDMADDLNRLLRERSS